MREKDLPERWLKRLEQYTDSKYGVEYAHRARLGASDFASGSMVHVEFPDGSQAFFKFAFALVAPEWQEVMVFTEHCGYHLFPLGELKVYSYEQDSGLLGEAD
jgi:hypothetical protein